MKILSHEVRILYHAKQISFIAVLFLPFNYVRMQCFPRQIFLFYFYSGTHRYIEIGFIIIYKHREMDILLFPFVYVLVFVRMTGQHNVDIGFIQ